jgi:hypothetical protein
MTTDELLARDAAIRQAAFDRIRALQSRDLVLSHQEIERGFQFEGQRYPFVKFTTWHLQAAVLLMGKAANQTLSRTR